MLLSGQGFSKPDKDIMENFCKFYPRKLLKHFRPGKLPEDITNESFPGNKILCAVNTVLEYNSGRANFNVTHDHFFFTIVKPNKGTRT